MCFEIEAQVKERFGQSAFDTEEECDQESSEASVPIEKRMNGLKLNMTECCLEKHGGSGRLIMKEFFQVSPYNPSLLPAEEERIAHFPDEYLRSSFVIF